MILLYYAVSQQHLTVYIYLSYFRYTHALVKRSRGMASNGAGGFKSLNRSVTSICWLWCNRHIVSLLIQEDYRRRLFCLVCPVLLCGRIPNGQRLLSMDGISSSVIAMKISLQHLSDLIHKGNASIHLETVRQPTRSLYRYKHCLNSST